MRKSMITLWCWNHLFKRKREKNSSFCISSRWESPLLPRSKALQTKQLGIIMHHSYWIVFWCSSSCSTRVYWTIISVTYKITWTWCIQFKRIHFSQSSFSLFVILSLTDGPDPTNAIHLLVTFPCSPIHYFKSILLRIHTSQKLPMKLSTNSSIFVKSTAGNSPS